MIYVERTLESGRVRRGVVGMVDLEQYDYEPGADTLIRATEGTVLSRIPPRVAVRKNAPIELPHAMVLADDPGRTVIEPLTALRDRLEPVYDFELMEHSGHLRGWLLGEAEQGAVAAALRALSDPAAFHARYGTKDKPVMLYAMGDGNHSLATAKACYERQKTLVAEDRRAALPARYALVELVNLHDDSLEFEPIHRVVFGVDPQKLLADLLAAYPGAHTGEGEGHQFTYVLPGERGTITVPNPTAQLAVGTLQNFLDRYLEENGGKVDYIHGEDVVEQLASQPGSIGFLLPAMGKDQLFPTVIFDGALPRKTFSMGEAHDKRFYLEARRIK